MSTITPGFSLFIRESMSSIALCTKDITILMEFVLKRIYLGRWMVEFVVKRIYLGRWIVCVEMVRDMTNRPMNLCGENGEHDNTSDCIHIQILCYIIHG